MCGRGGEEVSVGLDMVARWRKRAFLRHVATSGGSVVEMEGCVVVAEAS